MKKLLLLVVICLGFISCESKNVTIESTDVQIDGVPIYTYTMYGCEYLGRAIGGQSGVLTHKGNCKYCIKRNSK